MQELQDSDYTEIRIKYVKKLLEIIEGDQPPYEFSKLIYHIKKSFQNFPEDAGWKKSIELVDFLETHELATKAFPIGNTVVFVQPIVSPKLWIDQLRGEIKSDNPYEDDPMIIEVIENVPIVHTTNYRTFARYLKLNPDAVRLVSEDNFYTEYGNQYVSTPKLDLPGFRAIYNLVDFGIESGQTFNLVYNTEEILGSHEKLGEYYLTNYNFNVKDVQLEENTPFHNYKKLRELGFNKYSGFLRAVDLKYIFGDQLKVHDNMIKEIKSGNYENRFKDIPVAIAGGFSRLKDFIDAENRGCLLHNEYRALTEGGFPDLQLYHEAERKGFENFEIYEKSKDLGFPDFETYQKGITAGFEDHAQYQKALAKGFTRALDYLNAITLGFDQFEEYDRYMDKKADRIKILRPNIIELLSSLVDDDYPVTKVKDLVEGKVKDTVLENELIELLDHDPLINKYGKYHEESNAFRKRTNNRKISNNYAIDRIILDGSNIAWGSNSSSTGGKPSLQNIKSAVIQLQNINVKEIKIYIDPSLRHVIPDHEKVDFKEFVDNYDVTETPAQKEADEFILMDAIQNDTFIVTNDTFRDWIQANKKHARKIDYLRVTFVFDGDQIKFDSKLSSWFSTPES